jgi:hypothetical protein
MTSRNALAAATWSTRALLSLALLPLAGFAQQNNAARIAAAVLPLPPNMRAGATVVSVDDGVETVLRKGSNGMVCTADAPGDLTFYVNCFHETVHAALRRADELRVELQRAGKVPDDKTVDEAIEKEIKAGKLMPLLTPSIGFQMRGPLSGYDPAKNTVSKEIKAWQMIILPRITGAELHLPDKPEGDMPWVMNGGTLLAHIMIQH